MIEDLRNSWRGGLAYTGLFLVISVLRLGAMPLVPPVALLHLAVIFAVGCLLTVPLRRLVRRFPERHRLLVGAWVAALPFSVLGATVGGLLGPVGVAVYAATPVLVALGLARVRIGLRRA